MCICSTLLTYSHRMLFALTITPTHDFHTLRFVFIPLTFYQRYNWVIAMIRSNSHTHARTLVCTVISSFRNVCRSVLSSTRPQRNYSLIIIINFALLPVLSLLSTCFYLISICLFSLRFRHHSTLFFFFCY